MIIALMAQLLFVMDVAHVDWEWDPASGPVTSYEVERSQGPRAFVLDTAARVSGAGGAGIRVRGRADDGRVGPWSEWSEAVWISGGDSFDTDGDGVPDRVDRCLLRPDPDQLDADADGFGSACDADYNQDGIVGFPDMARIRAAFGTVAPELDMNGDGIIGLGDWIRAIQSFGHPPGPSADF